MAANSCPGLDTDTVAMWRLVACGGRLEPRRVLLAQAGSPLAALEAGPRAWRACGLEAAQVAALLAGEPPSAPLVSWLRLPGRHVVGWHDARYPPLLRATHRPPLALFVTGEPLDLWRPSVAVVGSRRPTPAGFDNAAAFARALADHGIAIASGLAAGIDAAAHRAALDADAHTIAVLGTGPDIAYPRSNRALHARIEASGTVASEHPPGTGPLKPHFPGRNRILAGLSLGTLVIEAARRSGALITARLAAEAGREVFALPGSIHNPLARGCHRLIRDGAMLVEHPDEVADAVAALAVREADGLRRRLIGPTSGAPRPRGAPVAPRGPGSGLAVLTTPRDSRDHNRLWHALGDDPMDMDQLVARSGLTAAEVSSMLLVMELEGRVTSQHGRYFRRH